MRNERPALWLDLVLVALFVAITAALAAHTPVLAADLAIRDFADAHRPHWFDTLLRILNPLGQGYSVLTPLAGLVALWMTWRTHSVRPFLPAAGAVVLTVVAIEPVKLWTMRQAPSSPKAGHPEYLFHQAGAVSYPSGHVVNTIVFYGVIATLVAGLVSPQVQTLIRYAMPALILFTTTFLSFHWITDGVAGVCMGLVVERILRRVPWDRVPLPARLAAWSGPLESR